MHDDITVIEQQPARIGTAFLAKRRGAFAFQGFFDFIEDSAELALAFSRTDNKIIRKTA
jgi:hypothetical protein